MRILGIDPGYDRLGVAIIDSENGVDSYVFSTCITTKSSDSFVDRLVQLGTELETLLTEYQPTDLAIEDVFFNTNQKTAIRVAEARGVILYLARKIGLTINEYTPPQIKLAVAGHGHADKTQVTTMVTHLITINKTIDFDDEYDALAVALTHSAIM